MSELEAKQAAIEILKRDLTKAEDTSAQLKELLSRVWKTYLDTGKIPEYMLMEIHRSFDN